MIVIKEKTVGSEHYKALGWKSIMPIPVARAGVGRVTLYQLNKPGKF